MHTSRFFASIFVIGSAVASGFTQGSLTIGDQAPKFPVDGYVKGNAITNFAKGKTYVVEFWATWCGPCISSMPHLSDMADKYKGKVDFISVNTWDYARGEDKKVESVAAHKARVQEWVNKNSDKMRYNVAFDDARDTISTTWMRAAGQNGIPCAMIVNKDQKIAWIGHPMEMEEPLKQVSEGTYDMAKFKARFDKEIEAEKASQKMMQGIAKKASKGFVYSIESDIQNASVSQKSMILSVALGQLSSSNPKGAMYLYRNNVGKIDGMQPYSWCSMARSLASKLKGDDQKELLSISENCAKMSSKDTAAIAFIYHAGALNAAGDKAGAKAWAEKAKAAVADYPAQGRESVTKFIDSQVASFK